jgi:hypothetical protein
MLPQEYPRKLKPHQAINLQPPHLQRNQTLQVGTHPQTALQETIFIMGQQTLTKPMELMSTMIAMVMALEMEMVPEVEMELKTTTKQMTIMEPKETIRPMKTTELGETDPMVVKLLKAVTLNCLLLQEDSMRFSLKTLKCQ